ILMVACTYHQNKIPLENQSALQLTGIYKINKMFNQKGEEVEDFHEICVFYGDKVFLQGALFEDVTYKVKKVKLKNYLLYKINKPLEDISNLDQYVEIISLYNEKTFVGYFILWKHNSLIGFYGNTYFFGEYTDKVDDNTFHATIQKHYDEGTSPQTVHKKPTSVFLALRRDGKDLADSDYITYFIYFDNNKQEIYRARGLYYPKSNGYSRLTVNNEKIGGYLRDEIDIDFSKDMKTFPDLTDRIYYNFDSLGKEYKKILYVNQDVCSYESYMVKKDVVLERKLRTFPLEKDRHRKNLSLSDIIGKDAKKTILSGVPQKSLQDHTIFYDAFNIGIMRKHGYWSLVHRINGSGKDSEAYLDVSVREYTKLLQFSDNQQSVTMEEINRMFSSADDYISSPEKNIAVVLVGGEYRVIHLDGYDGSEVFYSISEESASMVMNQWYIGTEAEVHQFYVRSSGLWTKIQ
ncbi:MAG: hypothetical protein Q4Q17_05960, partial [Tissierellia bacterium]|nr:hypothetical protein [Tissierellia bacterium]